MNYFLLETITLKLELAQFRELAAFTQFGSDLDKTTIDQLERGKRLSELLKQDEGVPIPVERQILSIFAGTNGYLDEFLVDAIHDYEIKMLAYVDQNHPDLLRQIREDKVIKPEVEKKVQNVLKEFAEEFGSLAAVLCLEC